MLIKYLKRYALINAVLFVGLVLIGIAVMLSTVFKTDPVILLGATAFFFLAAAVMFFVIRARKKKEKTKGTETELLSELKAMAGENDLSDKRL
jgi:type III secretory pathway component EscU